MEGEARAPERILVVDDEPDIARLVTIALAGKGYEIEVAHDGDQALEQARRFRPDLVVLDVMMPGRDGFDVCRQLRADARTVNASIVMLTARTQPGDRVAGLAGGADDYVPKPFHPGELAARVEALLRRSRQLRGVSPLTGLPGNFDIARELEVITARPDAHFALVHADLDDFKAYNDHYGFLRGDRAIKATATVILDAAGTVVAEPRFVGHIGGDDFAVIVAPDVVAALCLNVARNFDAMVPDLYDGPDRDQGFIEVDDRLGSVHRYSFLTISMGVATNEHRPITSATEASAIATEMKRLAKSTTGSVWRIDQRKA